MWSCAKTRLEKMESLTDGAHGPRANTTTTSSLGKQAIKEPTEQVIAECGSRGRRNHVLPPHPPMSAGNLRLCGLDGQGERQADPVGHIPGATCDPHRC